MLKKTGCFLLFVFIVIQFFRPAKNEDANAVSNDISKVFPATAKVKTILKSSCYDCHSNSTNYPWYASIQPVAWWLNNHINEGKREVNFNEFATYSIRRQYRKLEEVIEEVKQEEMPLASYTLIHRDAALTQAQRLALIEWATGCRDAMTAKYPADSLVKK